MIYSNGTHSYINGSDVHLCGEPYAKNVRLMYSDLIILYNTSQTKLDGLTAWTPNKITLPNNINYGSCFTASSGKVVIQKSGVVDCFLQLNLYISGYQSGDLIMYLYKNGAVIDQFVYSANNGRSYGADYGAIFGVQVNKGDYLEPFVCFGAGGNLRSFAGRNTFFAVQQRRIS